MEGGRDGRRNRKREDRVRGNRNSERKIERGGTEIERKRRGGQQKRGKENGNLIDCILFFPVY